MQLQQLHRPPRPSLTHRAAATDEGRSPASSRWFERKKSGEARSGGPREAELSLV